MDAIEVWNGPWDSFDQAALRRWHDAAHGRHDQGRRRQLRHPPAEQTRSACRRPWSAPEALSVEAIVAGYRAGHCWIAESSAVDLLDFTATLDDVSGGIGEYVPSDPGQEVQVDLELTGVDGCEARLLGPGAAIYGSASAVDGKITLRKTVPGGTSFVRAEVRRGGFPVGSVVALTNPIFLTAAG